MHSDNITGPSLDPWAVLGIPADAGEEGIRQAYLEKLHQFPPDRAPEEFERVRDAYELVRDPAMRMRTALLGEEPNTPLASLLDEIECERNFTGPGPWLAVLKEK